MAACSNEKTNKTESDVPVSSEEEGHESKAPTTEPPWDLPEDSELTGSEPNKDITTEPVEAFGDKYIELNKRCFAVNGKVYTLGVYTLQYMIDDSVPFNENDIANANKNLNLNYESSGFKIVLGEYYSAQVFVANYTEDNVGMANCILSTVYFPAHQNE